MINYTIIIPHKNTPDLLQKCLDSIPLREDIQVVVVDDNSSVNIVDFEHFPQWKGIHYESYFTKDGGGAGYARNIGLKHSIGKWIIFADADDFFYPCLSEVMDKYVDSSADIIFCKADSINLKDGRAAHRADGYNGRVDKALSTNNFQPALMYSIPTIKIFRAEKIQNLRFNECPCSNDVVFIAKVASVTEKFAADNSVIYCITASDNSITANRSLNNMLIRLQQDLEGIKYYKQKFVLTSEDKYWYFYTWWNVYERNIFISIQYCLQMFQAIGVYSFVSNYYKMTKCILKKRFK